MSADDETILLAEEITKLQAVVSAQGELISRMLAAFAGSEADPAAWLSSVRSLEERMAYASATLLEEEPSLGLLALMARKAEAKLMIFELAALLSEDQT